MKKRKKKNHAGKVVGTTIGGILGYCIGGVGIAAMGTAIGIPAMIVTVVAAGSGCAAGAILIEYPIIQLKIVPRGTLSLPKLSFKRT